MFSYDGDDDDYRNDSEDTVSYEDRDTSETSELEEDEREEYREMSKYEATYEATYDSAETEDWYFVTDVLHPGNFMDSDTEVPSYADDFSDNYLSDEFEDSEGEDSDGFGPNYT